jgi:hypothetical protein
VTDDTTPVFMEHFYGALRKGSSKDEALRQAQLSMIASKSTAHPYDWAAFELHGDWKKQATVPLRPALCIRRAAWSRIRCLSALERERFAATDLGLGEWRGPRQ